jgi:hypothetical protein
MREPHAAIADLAVLEGGRISRLQYGKVQIKRLSHLDTPGTPCHGS